MNNDYNLKLIIADDHNVVIQGLNSMLENNSWIVIVDQAKNGRELIKKYFYHKPDLILSDIKMPEMDGFSSIRKIKEKDKMAKVLFISAYSSLEMFKECIRSGGMGLIGKDVMKSELLFALKAVYDGNYYYKGVINPHIVHQMVSSSDGYSAQKKTESILPELLLTKKEIEIFNQMALGNAPYLICCKSDISKRTFNYHKKSIMGKLKLTSTEELIAYAVNYNKEKNIN